MKFRTEIRVAPFERPIDYADPVLALGSCFADLLRERLTAAKFRVSGNFAGPLYNPLSIADAIQRAGSGHRYTTADLDRDAEGRYFCYDTATRFDNPEAAAVAARCNEADEALGEALRTARHLVVTFGTAWVYRLRTTGAVVANCHRRPAELFRRERLTVEEIVARWSALLEGPLQGCQLILTVSPIRHLGDGLEENALSKALLRVAVAEPAERHPRHARVHVRPLRVLALRRMQKVGRRIAELAERHPAAVRYFPAFEILTDDLRDYRFYADDLVHPSKQAAAYIWERFAEAAFTPETRALLAEVERLAAFCRHVPREAGSEADRRACAKQIERIERSGLARKIDLSHELAQLKARIGR